MLGLAALDTFEAMGRFPATSSGEDVRVGHPCRKRFGYSANSTPGEPWYYYNRTNSKISTEGPDFYDLRGKQEIEFVGDPPIGWNGPNIYKLSWMPGVHPRPW
jgi:hypothetical protein